MIKNVIKICALCLRQNMYEWFASTGEHSLLWQLFASAANDDDVDDGWANANALFIAQLDDVIRDNI